MSPGGVDVDIMASYDWTSEESGGYDHLYELTCKQPSRAGRQWYALATARLQRKFVVDQPNEVRSSSHFKWNHVCFIF